ncbi:MAG: hypothetical protein WCH85_06465 [Methanomicrobiales archaeon]
MPAVQLLLVPAEVQQVLLILPGLLPECFPDSGTITGSCLCGIAREGMSTPFVDWFSGDGCENP